MRIAPLADVKARLSAYLDKCGAEGPIVITRNGRAAGVILSSEEYDALAETLEVLQDRELLDALAESEADVQEGRLHSLDEVKRQLGLA